MQEHADRRCALVGAAMKASRRAGRLKRVFTGVHRDRAPGFACTLCLGASCCASAGACRATRRSLMPCAKSLHPSMTRRSSNVDRSNLIGGELVVLSCSHTINLKAHTSSSTNITTSSLTDATTSAMSSSSEVTEKKIAVKKSAMDINSREKIYFIRI